MDGVIWVLVLSGVTLLTKFLPKRGSVVKIVFYDFSYLFSIFSTVFTTFSTISVRTKNCFLRFSVPFYNFQYYFRSVKTRFLVLFSSVRWFRQCSLSVPHQTILIWLLQSADSKIRKCPTFALILLGEYP